MNRTFDPPNKALVRSLWIRFAVCCALLLLAIGIFRIQAPVVGLLPVMFGTMIIILQSRPVIWREGGVIIFHYPAKKLTETKPDDAQISHVIEWTGYEGPLYDIVWRDGDTWTIAGKHGVSLEDITAALGKCGIAEVPTRKDFLVYRHNSAEEAALA